jgi:hypothetical protein
MMNAIRAAVCPLQDKPARAARAGLLESMRAFHRTASRRTPGERGEHQRDHRAG